MRQMIGNEWKGLEFTACLTLLLAIEADDTHVDMNPFCTEERALSQSC